MPPKLKNKAKMIYMPAAEAERLVAEASKSRSSTGSRYATPAPRRRKIPAPKGSAGRSGVSRPGYNLEEVLMLTKEQHSMLRLTVQRFVYKYCDVTKLYDANSMAHKLSVISCCLDVHPWLAYYEDEWPVTVIMRQILVKTSHNYCFEDWGDEELLERMKELEDTDDDEESNNQTPLPKKATKSSSSKSSSKSSSVKTTKSTSSANKTPSVSSYKKKAAPTPFYVYESDTPIPSTKKKSLATSNKPKTTATTSHLPKEKSLKVKKRSKKRGASDEPEAEESGADEEDEVVVANETDSDEESEEEEEDDDRQEQEQELNEREGEKQGTVGAVLDDDEEIGDPQEAIARNPVQRKRRAVEQEKDDEDEEDDLPLTPTPAARRLPATRTQLSPNPTRNISIAAAFASQAPPHSSKPPTARINATQKAGAVTEDVGKGKNRVAAVKPAAKARSSKRNADNANILDENIDGTQRKRPNRGGN